MYWKSLLFSLAIVSGFGGTPSEPLKRLIDGNVRYAEDECVHADHSADRRGALLQGQSPFATILSCSDSRVIPEVIFDQGVGDLFVVRVAGNVVGPIELDSIDYSVKVLGSSLILVLGHEACGAVKATFEDQASGISHVAALIEPAIQKATNLEEAIKANVQYIVADLRKRLIKEKGISIVGAYYRMATGNVEILFAK